MTAFELAVIGGPWQRRLAPRRCWLDAVTFGDHTLDRDPSSLAPARALWTRTAFSEYASAAAFAEIASALLAAGAPIDLVAAAGDFVVEEIVHSEAAARVAAWLGGAVDLAVDLERLVRPSTSADPLLRAATLVVRTSCVGEAMTVPMLKLARRCAGDPVVDEVLGHIVADESGHAQLGWWFLDWAAPRLTDAARVHLGREAGQALRAFSVVLTGDHDATDRECARGLGGIAGRDYDSAFAAAAQTCVADPLAVRGITVPTDDLSSVGARS